MRLISGFFEIKFLLGVMTLVGGCAFLLFVVQIGVVLCSAAGHWIDAHPAAKALWDFGNSSPKDWFQ